MTSAKNLEAGVARAMKAYLKESGASDASADARVQAQISQAVAFVRQKMAEDNEPDVLAAFGLLKNWTFSNA